MLEQFCIQSAFSFEFYQDDSFLVALHFLSYAIFESLKMICMLHTHKIKVNMFSYSNEGALKWFLSALHQVLFMPL